MQMGPEHIFDRVRKQMKAKTWCITVRDMDHGFKCPNEQEEKLCNGLGVIAGCWLEGDVSDLKNPVPWDTEHGTEMEMCYDEVEKMAVWSEWRPLMKDENERLLVGLGPVFILVLAVFLVKYISGVMTSLREGASSLINRLKLNDY